MPGHEDPKGTVIKNKEGKLFLRINKNEPSKIIEEPKFDEADLNQDGEVDGFEKIVDSVKKLGKKRRKVKR